MGGGPQLRHQDGKRMGEDVVMLCDIERNWAAYSVEAACTGSSGFQSDCPIERSWHSLSPAVLVKYAVGGPSRDERQPISFCSKRDISELPCRTHIIGFTLIASTCHCYHKKDNEFVESEVYTRLDIFSFHVFLVT